jgi:hypothetical protein
MQKDRFRFTMLGKRMDLSYREEIPAIPCSGHNITFSSKNWARKMTLIGF